MSQLRIVLVMIDPPLPFGNATARGFYVLLKGLVARGHHVTAFAACHQPDDLARARALFPAPTYDLRLYPVPSRSGWHFQWQRFARPYSFLFSEELLNDLHGTLALGFDVLHLEPTWAAWLGIGHVGRSLISVHDLAAIDLGDQRPRNVREAVVRSRLIRTEKRLLKTFQHFRTTSSRLEGPLHAINPKASTSTVPLGLDLDLFAYIPDHQRVGDHTLALIGSMDSASSHAAAIRLLARLWPQIKRRVPDAKLQIVGWSARDLLFDYVGQRDVVIEGNVPELRPYFESSSVMLYAPSRGGGMRVRVQEAMAYGIPVVTTGDGVEGLPALDGVHAGICDEDAGLIERTVTLLLDPALQNQQRLAARCLLEHACGAAVTLNGIEAIYATIQAKHLEKA